MSSFVAVNKTANSDASGTQVFQSSTGLALLSVTRVIGVTAEPVGKRGSHSLLSLLLVNLAEMVGLWERTFRKRSMRR